ncbi:MarR family winged helix-turn-helix transcriptional regulator [Bacillus altitudinis]|uniref:MarR family winged helix-turn-helix transcriptional regulator n=1 Tax=Bacillus altitudinis TaxID=293387 RepID=UPI002540D2FC|nr:MarR family transcriptional regulator [Bacillus altitudinis]
MQHFELEASLLDHALTKYLKATKRIDEENIPKNVTNVKGFILRIIYRHQSCTVKNILQEVSLSPSATTTALNHLEDEGLIIRSRNNNDRRTVWITLSESGEQIARQMIDNRQLLVNQLFNHLSEEDKKKFFELIEKMMDEYTLKA